MSGCFDDTGKRDLWRWELSGPGRRGIAVSVPGIPGPAEALRGGLCGCVAGAAQRAVGSGLGLTRVDAAGPGQGRGPLDSSRIVAAASRARKLNWRKTPLRQRGAQKSWTTSGLGSSSQAELQRPVLPGAAGVNKEAELGKAGHPCAEMDLHMDEHLC